MSVLRMKYKLEKVDVASVRRLFDFFTSELRDHRGRLLLSGFSLLGASLMTILQPWPLKIVFDYVLMPGADVARRFVPENWGDLQVLWVAALAVLVITALRGTFTYLHNVQSRIVRHGLVAEIRLRLFSHVQRLPQSYHDYRETGELMTRMTGDINLVADLLVDTPIILVSNAVLVLGMLAIVFWINPLLGLIALSVIPLFVFAAFQFSGRIKSAARKQREAYGQIVQMVQESIAGLSQVKGFAQEKRREKLIGKSVGRDARANVRTTKLSENYARTVDLITAAGTCAVLIVGGYRALTGQITPGDVLIVLAYMRSMYRPLRGIAKLTTRVSKATVRGEKVVELLSTPTEVNDAPGAISARGIGGDIRFESVGFEYASGRRVLDDVSCHIPVGQTTLIIGPTGAGKSTIARLILRLYEPSEGRVLLDGRDIKDYRVASLRKRVTPLTQEAFLFRTSLAENIAFGVKNATPEDVVRASVLAGADEFIQALPDGYDTLVGEGGVTLSGGQRHRVSFARALLRRSPVMIFDEPATGLDIYSESETKKVLGELGSDRTLLVITHRLHFLDMADWVVFIENGRVVEEGSPDELVARRGDFHRYVSGNDTIAPDAGYQVP